MKKIILLLVIVITIPIIIIEDSSKDHEYYNNEYPDLPKDEKWEYVKNRIAVTHFKGSDNKYDFKYSGPILFNLKNATTKDSIAFNEVLKKFNEVLPNKEIGHFKNFTDCNFDVKRLQPVIYHDVPNLIRGYKIRDLVNKTIQFKFLENNDSLPLDADGAKVIINNNPDFNFGYTIDGSNAKYGLDGYHRPKISFGFNKNITIEERRKSIEYHAVQLIGAMASRIRVKEKVLNSSSVFYNEGEMTSKNKEISDLDWFLLQKLYSENLYKEFRAYLYKAYPWNYASNYLNKEKTKVFAIWFSVILGVVFFIIGFSLFHEKKYKEVFWGYFQPIAYTLITILYLYKVYIYITKPYEFEHWKQYIAIHVIFLILAVFISFALMLFDKYILKDKMNFTSLLFCKVISMFLLGIIPVLIIFVAENNKQPWYSLNTLFLLVFALSIGRGLLYYLDYFSENLVKQKDIELSNIKALKSQAEVSLLQSQINPHFLYNSLNSIASLAQKDGAKTEKMALSLSDLFKYTINRKGKKESTIKDELEMVKNYLDVEQIRFGDRLTFNIEVDENLNDVKIPMFLIQPLVENAIKHGVSKVENDGELQLIIKKQDNDLLIKVLDNGPQFPDGLVSGHGLQTVYDLLKLSYDNSALVNYKNEPQKEITITIKNIV